TPLVTTFGDDPAGYIPRVGRLIAQPIVRNDGRFIVALPGVLLEAARYHVVSLAIVYAVQIQLGQQYCEEVWQTVRQCLRRLDLQESAHAGIDVQDVPNSQEALYQHDADKFTQVMLVIDPLLEHQLAEPFGQWRLNEYSDRIERR